VAFYCGRLLRLRSYGVRFGLRSMMGINELGILIENWCCKKSGLWKNGSGGGGLLLEIGTVCVETDRYIAKSFDNRLP